MARMKPRRTGLNWCSARNLPFGSHHSAASRVNLAISSGSTEERASVAGRGDVIRILGGVVTSPRIRRLSRAGPASMYGPQKSPAPDPQMAQIVIEFGGTSVADIGCI